MRIVTDFEQLPPRVHRHLLDVGILGAQFLAAVKTAYKPNATIPILWMVVHKAGLVFCCTHRTRGIFKQYLANEVNSVRIRPGSGFGPARIEVISPDLAEEDFSVSLPDEVGLDRVREFLVAEHYQVI